ncbi:hypothetical protein CDD81_1450 [Ophiocordyceps australis]|uniref:Uncharacterized protein n=1 Tax=Ophiocordyceps australis TaxID=1399860 RepID=A0A2C5YDN6_9HYPO|nr:hypothetical protein CDD81_1450 [Ophiocordyceps australis]
MTPEIEPLYRDVYLDENSAELGPGTPSERREYVRLGLHTCDAENARHLFYRQMAFPQGDFGIESLPNADYQVINGKRGDAITMTITRSIAKVRSTSVEWRFDGTVSKSSDYSKMASSDMSKTTSSEDSNSGVKHQGKTWSTDRASTSGSETSNSQGGSGNMGFNFFDFGLGVEAHHENRISRSKSEVLSKSDMDTTGATKTDTSTHSDTDTFGKSHGTILTKSYNQASGKGASNDLGSSAVFVQEVALQAECPPRHFCTIQTWTFAWAKNGTCPKIPFFDFSRCRSVGHCSWSELKAIMASFTAREDMFGGKSFCVPPTNVTLGAIRDMRHKAWQHVNSQFLKTKPRYKGPYVVQGQFRNGLLWPLEHMAVEYKQNVACGLSIPLLLPDGTPYRTQILFEVPLQQSTKIRRDLAYTGRFMDIKVKILSSSFLTHKKTS